MKKIYIYLFYTFLFCTLITSIKTFTFYNIILSSQKLTTKEEINQEWAAAEKEYKRFKENESKCKYAKENLMQSFGILAAQNLEAEIKDSSCIRLARILSDKEKNYDKALKYLDEVINFFNKDKNLRNLSNAYSEKVTIYKSKLKRRRKIKNLSEAQKNKYLEHEGLLIEKIHKNSALSKETLQKAINTEWLNTSKTLKLKEKNILRYKEYMLEDAVTAATYAIKYIQHSSCPKEKIEKYKNFIEKYLEEIINFVDNSEDKNNSGIMVLCKVKAIVRLASFYRQYNQSSYKKVNALQIKEMIKEAKMLLEKNKKLLEEVYYDDYLTKTMSLITDTIKQE